MKKPNGHATAVPSSPEMERSALGAIVLDNNVYPQAAEFLRSADFFIPSHQKIFTAMMELAGEGSPIDFATLQVQLEKHGWFEIVGGNDYIMSLTDGMPRVKNISHYVKVLLDKSTLRNCMISAEKVISKAQEPDAEPADVFHLMEDHLSRIRKVSGPKTQAHDAGDGAALLSEVSAHINTYMSMTASQNIAVTFWTMHTHAFAAARSTPYLLISSAEKESGKSTLLEVLEQIVRNKWRTSRTSAAVLPRKIEDQKPTLLLDETDQSLKSSKEYAAALTGALNDGYRYNGATSLCVVEKGSAITYRDFSLFCAKAIAGVGSLLDDTTVSRCIPIRLKRQKRDAAKAEFDPDEVEPYAFGLRDRLAAWGAAHIDTLAKLKPEFPKELGGRQRQVTKPLLAIADVVGGDWPTRLRSALLELYSSISAEDQSHGVALLKDIRLVFAEKQLESIGSKDLVAALNTLDDRPWSEANHGKPITPTYLSKHLQRYEISPHQIWHAGANIRGYEKADFKDCWERYLKVDPEVLEVLEPNKDAGKTLFSGVLEMPPLAPSKTAESPANTHGLAGLADKTPVADTPQGYEAQERAAIREFM